MQSLHSIYRVVLRIPDLFLTICVLFFHLHGSIAYPVYGNASCYSLFVHSCYSLFVHS
uniref:Uncharacterized protein n=1 Tax=Arundo donax TaxID=35708 RepID=A0A0A9BAC3_ARUDO